jgi:predicted DNA binding protein/CheY-like chemotaxis protein
MIVNNGMMRGNVHETKREGTFFACLWRQEWDSPPTMSTGTQDPEARDGTESEKTDDEKKVLVVDDERNLVDLYEARLSEDYEVVTAQGGEEAIEEYDSDVDVALLDRRMPGTSGDEVLEEIRDLPGDCVAAMVTAVEPEHDIVSMEFEDYVQKPVSEDELVAVVDELSDLSERGERQRRSHEIESKSAALGLYDLAETANGGEPDPREMYGALAEAVSSVCLPAAVEVWSLLDGDATLEVRECYEAGDWEGGETLAWKAYSGDTVQTVFTGDEIPEPESAPSGCCLTNRVGEHGVVLVFPQPGDELTEDDRASVNSAAVMAGASLDTERYKKEAEQNRRLSDEYRRRKDELEKLDRMVRETSVGVLRAKTRTEIERTACRKLADSDLVEFVWMGEYVESGDSMVSVFATDEGYIEEMEAAGGPEEAKEAAEEGETRVVEGVGRGPSPEPWEEQAVRNGFGSVLRVPVGNGPFHHGVLNVYTGEDDVNDRMVSAVEDIGTVVGHALDSYETTASLVSEEMTEVRVRIEDPAFPPVRFSSEVGGEVRLKGIAPTEKNGQKAYVGVETDGNTKESVEEAAEKLPSVRCFSHVSSSDGAEEFRFTGDAFFLQDALKHGATPVDMEATPEGAEMTVRLSERDSASSFASMIKKEYDGVALLSTTKREDCPETKSDFIESLRDELTERQIETVQTAYYSGYFGSPREMTGTEVADEMGVSQPTVTENIKAAERTVFGMLFDE